MIRKNASVPDNFFELREMESIQAYAMAYGDQIAKRYEDLDIVYFPRFPLDIDADFFRVMQVPAQFKKVGTVNGLDKPILIRNADKVMFDHTHVLHQIFGDRMIAAYAQTQIRSVNDQIRRGLHLLFPRYASLTEANITWRLTETIEEPMHIDGFLGGKPTPPQIKGRYHRVKLFINIDSEPRKWWTSYTMPETLKRYRGQLPASLPDDADQVACAIAERKFLWQAPHHEIDIPPMGAVMGEAQGLSHAVRYGRRMIAAEFMCLAEHMLDPSKQCQAKLKGWLGDANIGIADAAA
jgi:hypothetical protein